MTFAKAAITTALAATLLAGCKSSTDNEGNEPIIHTPGRVDVTVTATAPAGYYPVQTLDVGLAASTVTMFVGFGYDFTDPDDLLQFFLLPTGGTFDFNIEKGNLMMIEAFNPVARDYMATLVGYQSGDEPANLGSFAIGPFSEAIADQVLVMNPSPSQGLTDEYQAVNLSELFDDAAKTQLVLEGYTRTDAENATDGDKQGALDRLMVDASAADTNINAFMAEYLSGSVWQKAGSDMSLSFSADGVTYNDGSSNITEGTYDLVRSAGVTSLEVTLPVIGTESITFDGVIAGDDNFTFLSNTLVKQ